MPPIAGEPWRPGQRVSVRGDVWTIVERSAFADCEALRLSGTGFANAGTTRTILTPFDRPVRLERPSSIEIMRPRRWLRTLRRLGTSAHPFGALSAAAGCSIDLLPYQLEPALAVMRRGVTRVMIADAVGLGKTIQAGLILNELASKRESFRALVVAPAGLREQWSHELTTRFGLPSTIAGAAWLARIGRDMPADVNPWVLPGIYVSSFDFIKRPEVLRPLEDAVWDALVVDEAHAAAPGTARRAAVHAVALRSRRVVLLTATPHTGDAAQFHALCGIGETDARVDRLLWFRRTRADVGPHTPRRTALLAVRLSEAERRMHRLLEGYTARVCREARVRGDARARLAAMVLKKRALSSAASLAVSCRRRLALLAGAAAPPGERQLMLPLADEDPLEDGEPDSILAVPGLSDSARERRWLATIAEKAGQAARSESKTRFLLRLLSRMREPVIVFTEYRDTLERLRRAVAPSHPDVAVLHGGLNPTERSAVQQAFNAAGSLLLATDAASEGLNLHGRCRAVVHYELPWSPARLEQRTGRVDRIGQSRVVHEIILVADDTAERLVLAPLTRRAATARRSLTGPSRLLDLLTESRIAGAILDGTPVEMSAPDDEEGHGAAPAAELHAEAVTEAGRLRQHRVWAAAAARAATNGRIAATAIARYGQPGFVCIYTFSLAAEDGTVAHAETTVVHVAGAIAGRPRTAAAARRLVREFVQSREPAVRRTVREWMTQSARLVEDECARAIASLAQRERAIAAATPSAAQQLVQAGLFDQRSIRANAARSRTAGTLLEASEQRLLSLAASGALTATLDLTAVLIASGRSRR